MRRAALLAVAAATAVALVPARAHAARGMEVAVQDDGVFLGRYFDRDRTLGLARKLHATRIRSLVSWAVATGAQAQSRRVPRRVRFDFSRWDALIAAAAARGMRVQLVLTGPAPAFAAGNRRVGPVRPNVHLFGQFVAAAARHFKGRVDRYSLWNEPNHKGWLQPLASAPHIYRSLYVTGHRVIKAIDPSAQVLIGELVPYDIRRGRVAIAPLRFLREMLCVDARYRRSRCGHVRADGFAHHAYDFTHAPTYRYPGADNVTIGVLGRLNQALDRLRRIHALAGPRGPLGVYITEYGLFASGRYRIPEARRALYLAQAFGVALRAPRVREMLQYLLVRPPKGSPGDFFATWLTDRDGMPLPAFTALAAFGSRAAREHAIATAR